MPFNLARSRADISDVDLGHCASCGAPTQGTYRCLGCERAGVAAATSHSSEPKIGVDTGRNPDPTYRPFDAMSALITLGINGRPGSIGRGIGIAVALLAGGVATFMIVLGVITSVQSW